MNRQNISKIFKTAVSTQFPRALDVDIKDFIRLRPTKWLNEEVINAYFALLSSETPASVLYINSWFLADLHTNGYGKVNKRIKAVGLRLTSSTIFYF
jgi:Ulp1 family protease